jgi:hypothetical protein
MGSGGKTPFIVNLSTRWRRTISFMLQPLYFRRRLGGPQGQFESNSSSCPCMDSNSRHPAKSRSLYWLSYPDQWPLKKRWKDYIDRMVEYRWQRMWSYKTTAQTIRRKPVRHRRKDFPVQISRSLIHSNKMMIIGHIKLSKRKYT